MPDPLPNITQITIGGDSYQIKDENAKRLQTVVSGPSGTSGTTTAFVDSITQNAEGVISYTTKQISAEIPGTAEYAEALTPGAKIDGVDFDGSAGIVHFAICSSSSGSNATVICPGFGSTLAAGARITIKFTADPVWVAPNSVAKLNIYSSASDTTGTGLKDIKYRGNAVVGYSKNEVVELVYDGTDWQEVGEQNTDTTYVFDGTYNASTNKAATVSTVTNAINALDVTSQTVGASKTLTALSETNGKISFGTVDIAIDKSKVSGGTANMVAVYTSGGVLSSSSNITATELGYLDGVTSNIQQQINAISGGGTDHIRFYKSPLSFAAAISVATSQIIGGYTVSQNDILVGTDGQFGKVGSISGTNTAIITKLGSVVVSHSYSNNVLTIGPVGIVAAS